MKSHVSSVGGSRFLYADLQPKVAHGWQRIHADRLVKIDTNQPECTRISTLLHSRKQRRDVGNCQVASVKALFIEIAAKGLNCFGTAVEVILEKAGSV